MIEGKSTRLRDFTNLTIIVASLLSGIVVILFFLLDKIGGGEVASFSVFCIYLVGFATWEMRDRKWYFPLFLFFVFLHFIAIYIAKDLTNFPFMILFPFAAIDVFGAINFMNKLDLRSE